MVGAHKSQTTLSVKTYEKHLKCLLLNARSLMNKMDIFAATVVSIDPDIIGVTES